MFSTFVANFDLAALAPLVWALAGLVTVFTLTRKRPHTERDASNEAGQEDDLRPAA